LKLVIKTRAKANLERESFLIKCAGNLLRQKPLYSFNSRRQTLWAKIESGKSKFVFNRFLPSIYSLPRVLVSRYNTVVRRGKGEVRL
jgi:hypothetical protein